MRNGMQVRSGYASETLGSGVRADHQSASHGRNVLIVQSDYAMARSMAILLENAGYRIVAIVRTLADLAARISGRPADADIAIVDHSGTEDAGVRAVELLRRWNVPFVSFGRPSAPAALPASADDAPWLGAIPWTADILRAVASTLRAGRAFDWNERSLPLLAP